MASHVTVGTSFGTQELTQWIMGYTELGRNVSTSPGVARDPASPGVVEGPASPGVARDPALPGAGASPAGPQEAPLPAPQKRGRPAIKKGGEVRRPAPPAALSRQDGVWREPRERELPATKNGGVPKIPPWPPPRNNLLPPLPGLRD
ncbi:UNVERIFIED_CONTAM: hypothetical protein FKN15_015218 [Acipenser sinensis]